MQSLNVLARAGLIGLLTVWGGQGAFAQEFPNRAITIVVPNGPGAADIPFRIIAPAMAKVLGQPVVVENREGAATLIGSNYVAKERPADGYTLSGQSVNALLTLPLTVKNSGLDPLKELPPLLNVSSSKLVLVANANQPWKTFPEMVAYAKANPGKLNYASSSSTTRLLTEMLFRAEGIDVAYVPFRATGTAITSIQAGETQVGLTIETLALAGGDKLRVIGQTGDKRSAKLPDVPTFAELGYPKLPGATYTLNVRAGTPKPIADKLYAAAEQALKDPEVQAQFDKLSMQVMPPLSTEDVIKSEQEQSKNFADVAKQIGLEPE
jgi:tripartite-type tricarboxylate transporter receptor subunit TctC